MFGVHQPSGLRWQAGFFARSGSGLVGRIKSVGCRHWRGVVQLHAIGVILCLAMMPGVTPTASADQLQNSAVQGDAATLAANGFGKVGAIVGTLNGEGANVGVIEVGGSVASPSGLANVAGILNKNTAPNSSLVNGNPDLPSSVVTQFQFAGGVLPAGGSTAAALGVGNHATQTTGVIVGQGRTAAADLGIAYGSQVFQGGITGAATAPGGDNAVIQQAVMAMEAGGGSFSNVNMSYGAFQGPTLTLPSGTVLPNGFTQATNAGGQALFVKAGGGTTATPGAADPVYMINGVKNPIPVYTVSNLGVPLGATNNGASQASQFVDYEASVTNTLMVVAGNEGPNYTSLGGNQVFFPASPNGGAPNLSLQYGSPSDAFNILNVGATGVRTTAGAALNYSQASPYNTPNATSDGRIGVDLVAPGGDPLSSLTYNFANYNNYLTGANNTAASTATVPVNGFISQFKTTAGGVGTTASDTYNGKGPAATPYSDVTTASSFFTAPTPNIFNGVPGGTIAPSAIAGTSFAAPLVAGSAAVVDQYGLLASAQNVKSTVGNFNFSRNATDPLDHRVLKAILMNGASHYEPNGPLLRSTGTPWTASAPLQGAKALPAPLAAKAVGPQTNQAQSGLDPTLGSGMLNVLGSLNNYAAGEQGPGAPGAANVQPIGWDFETVAAGAPANTLYTYNFSYGGTAISGFQATLAWDAPVAVTANAGPNDAKGNATFVPNATAANATTFGRGNLTDLDLYFFQVNPNGTLLELGSSNSNVDNEEYIYDQPLSGGSPTAFPAGNYQLDVVAPAGNTTAAAVPFGVAWSFSSVPEPATAVMLLAPMMLLARRRSAK